MLPELVQEGDTVIDAGTGTGILSIAAIKLGADHALAFDIDEWSIENTRENILINNVDKNISVKRGSSEVISKGKEVDLLLANIERNTILKLLPTFLDALKPEGDLVLSGLLETDQQDIIDQLSSRAHIINITRENEWIAIHAQIDPS